MPCKNNSRPIKPSEGSTMTHEDEELQHDLSKLQEQVQQISLLQSVGVSCFDSLANKKTRQHQNQSLEF